HGDDRLAFDVDHGAVFSSLGDRLGEDLVQSHSRDLVELRHVQCFVAHDNDLRRRKVNAIVVYMPRASCGRKESGPVVRSITPSSSVTSANCAVTASTSTWARHSGGSRAASLAVVTSKAWAVSASARRRCSSAAP